MASREIQDKKVRWSDYGEEYAIDHVKSDLENDWEFKKILKLSRLQPRMNVLEIGCNTGEFCNHLYVNYNVAVVGIDINKYAIEIAKQRYPILNFERQDLFDIEGKYDRIYMLHVIEHLEDPERALEKISDLLNNHGMLIISCPNKWAYICKLAYIMRDMKFGYDPTHVNEFSPHLLSKQLRSTGYSIESLTTGPLGIPLLYSISKTVYYGIPSYLFGGHIICTARKNL